MASILVGDRAEFASGRRIVLSVGSAEVCVLQQDEKYFAYENRCPHQGGPVGEGIVIGRVECTLDENKRTLGERFSDTEQHLVCPWHGWEFNLETGRAVTNSKIGLRKFEVRIDGDNVYLEVPDGRN